MIKGQKPCISKALVSDPVSGSTPVPELVPVPESDPVSGSTPVPVLVPVPESDPVQARDPFPDWEPASASDPVLAQNPAIACYLAPGSDRTPGSGSRRKIK